MDTSIYATSVSIAARDDASGEGCVWIAGGFVVAVAIVLGVITSRSPWFFRR